MLKETEIAEYPTVEIVRVSDAVLRNLIEFAWIAGVATPSTAPQTVQPVKPVLKLVKNLGLLGLRGLGHVSHHNRNNKKQRQYIRKKGLFILSTVAKENDTTGRPLTCRKQNGPHHPRKQPVCIKTN